MWIGTPDFHPSPRDRETLGWAEQQRFGLFAPFSKRQKTLPADMIGQLLPRLNEWLDGRCSVFGVARGYRTVNERTQDLRPYASVDWLIDLGPHELSVPGSIELARRAAFYVGANSCLALVTMSRGIPTVIFEPQDHTNPKFWPKLFDLEQCLLLQKFDAVNLRTVLSFLAERMVF